MKLFSFKHIILFLSIVFSKVYAQQAGQIDASFNVGTGTNFAVQTIALQPDGKVLVGGNFYYFNGTPSYRIARLNAYGSLDITFDPGNGPSTMVYSIALQPDGKILVGGFFTSYNGTSRSRIARLNADGSLDTTFDPGTGANSLVYSITLKPDGKILIGGSFTSYNGTSRSRIARLNADGSLDTTFDPGTGANGHISSIALQPDGKVLIGGNFTSFNGISQVRTARLNADGSLDASFDPQNGANNTINSIALQPDGKVLIGGYFNYFNGTSRSYIARLNGDGSLDSTFDPGTGSSGVINAVTLQPNGKVLIGGNFNSYNGTSRSYIARLNADGSLDTTFDPGYGADGSINSIVLQPNDKVLIGGNFNSYDSTSSKGIARVYGIAPTGCGTGNFLVSDSLSICDSNYTLNAGTGYSSYSWSTGATTPSIFINASGSYSCTVTDSAGCSYTDQVYVDLFHGITATQLNICAGDNISLSVASAPHYSYLWSTGETTASISPTPNQTTTYTCRVSNGTNSCIDSITVYVDSIAMLDLGPDTVAVCGNSYTLDAGSGFSSCVWSTGDTTSTITVNASGLYSCITFNRECSKTDSIYVSFLDVSITASHNTVCLGGSVSLTTMVSITDTTFVQLGDIIYGEAVDRSGHIAHLSADGTRLAIGAPYSDLPYYSGAGHTRVFEWINNNWSQIGQDINGEASNDLSGYSVSLSADGNRLAVGAYRAELNDRGHTRVYELINNNWIQLGQTIYGDIAFDNSGYSVSLSADGTRIAIGAPGNDGNGNSSGHTRVYEWVNNGWSQIGQDINGEAANDLSGWSVSLSANGTRLAIGAPYNDGNGTDAGHTRVFELINNNWIQIGQDINGDAAIDNSGYSVSLSSDGARLAVGAYRANSSDAGQTRVYELINNNWIKLGQDINGESANDHSGFSVSLSADGNRLAVGARFNDGNGADAGHARVFEWVNNSWSQISHDIDGLSANDNSGISVSMSADGNRLAVVSRFSNGIGSYYSFTGNTRVFSIPPDVDRVNSGLNFLWSNGDTNATISVSPTQTTTYHCVVSDGIASCEDSVTITFRQSITQANVVGNYRVNINWNSTGAAVYQVWYRLIGESTWNKVLANSNFRSLFPLAPGNYEYYISEAGNVNSTCIDTFTITCEDFNFSSNVFQIVDATRGKVNIFGITGGRRTWDIGMFQAADTTWANNVFSNRFKNLSAGTYYFMVRDKYGCYSSQIDTAIINPRPSYVPTLQSVQNLGGGSITVNWSISDPSQVNAFQVRVKDLTSGGAGTLYQTYIVNGGTSTTYTITGLPPARYRFDVRARPNNGTFADGVYSLYMERVVQGNKSGFITEATESTYNSLVNIYPNPTNDLLYVQAPEGSELELLDMNGKRIAQRSTKSTEEVFDLRELAQGVYILQISSEGVIHRERVVKN